MTEKLTLKTSLLPLSTLDTTNLSLDQISDKLAAKRAAAPGLFSRFPCILCLAKQSDSVFTLQDILNLCEQHGILIIGVTGELEGWRAEIHRLRLAEFTGNGESTPINRHSDVRELKIHQGNVRSGQQLYSKGDLIVMGNVSPGADVIAARDIHIQGQALGRVIAGTPDNENAIITGHKLDPELISIAGNYQTYETRTHTFNNEFTVVQLDEHKLTYTTRH